MPQSKFKNEIEKRQCLKNLTRAIVNPIEGFVEGYAIVFEQMTPMFNPFILNAFSVLSTSSHQFILPWNVINYIKIFNHYQANI